MSKNVLLANFYPLWRQVVISESQLFKTYNKWFSKINYDFGTDTPPPPRFEEDRGRRNKEFKKQKTGRKAVKYHVLVTAIAIPSTVVTCAEPIQGWPCQQSVMGRGWACRAPPFSAELLADSGGGESHSFQLSIHGCISRCIALNPGSHTQSSVSRHTKGHKCGQRFYREKGSWPRGDRLERAGRESNGNALYACMRLSKSDFN